jgi:hypothetical protein
VPGRSNLEGRRLPGSDMEKPPIEINESHYAPQQSHAQLSSSSTRDATSDTSASHWNPWDGNGRPTAPDDAPPRYEVVLGQ